MRNLIVSCDGTWNTPDQENDDGLPTPTNIVRLHNLILTNNLNSAPGGIVQMKYYHPGVGTDGNLWERVKGGGAGYGLSLNVKSGYKWLAENYETGDQIFLFGFSRGAYTVRSLAGLIGKCGLIKCTKGKNKSLEEKEVWRRVDAAYDRGYRKGGRAGSWIESDWELHQAPDGSSAIPIRFLGVFDTVGALGIPDDMAILNLFDDPRDFEFHDTELGKHVQTARHAVALDEMRASFTPTLWTAPQGQTHPDMKQVWFPGVHSDVGGGYLETGLSDAALDWMIGEAKAQGLLIDAAMAAAHVRPRHDDVLHNSRRGKMAFLRTQPRSVPDLGPNQSPNIVHPSVKQRQLSPPITQAPYRESIHLEKGGDRKLAIYAANPWNYTGLYVKPGERYLFEAVGEWIDGRTITCGPDGTDDGRFNVGEVLQLAASALGLAERAFKSITGNDEADFRGTRREESFPWFSLVGAIANGVHSGGKGDVPPHETFWIGSGCTYPPTNGSGIAREGYLYCFANDAWHFYGNNHGSVKLDIRRIK